MSTEIDALRGLQTLLQASLDPSPQAAPTGIYVYTGDPQDPGDYESSLASLMVNDLPIVIISQQVAVPGRLSQKAVGLLQHDWVMSVYILIAVGPLKYPNSVSAAAEAKQMHWATALAKALAVDYTLGGTVDNIGVAEGAGRTRTLFTYIIDHTQWNQQVYWGLRFVIPVVQRFTL